MPIHKAIIPAAGFGTRMLPAAKSIPKEMLPILDRPTIQFVVEEAAAAGIDDLLLITSRNKRAIEDHFDRDAELEQRLSSANKQSLLSSIQSLMAKVTVHSVRQPEQRGLGDAVNRARRHVGDEPFLCLLGDTIFSGGSSPAAQLVDAHRELGTALIGLEQVPPENVERYGIVGGTEIRPGVLKLDTLVEKPSKNNAPSHFAIAARYLLTPSIFDCLDRTTPGKGGEIQLTDALKLLLRKEPIHGIVLQSRRHDIGNPVDWLKTNLLLARQDPKLWDQLLPLVRSLLQ
ncbi:MAG: UTP--glucose-1-phosphate uridylyltransferase GalU [Phycisphaerales bacterium]|nr:UTP--glucose-1-phosphate uridylyltransferase GalU [Phycisphaerales bacterium]